MISVLLFSRTQGITGWAAVRGSTVIRGTGLKKGDLIRLDLMGEDGANGVAFFLRERDGEIGIPWGTKRIRAEHLKTSGNPVCVNLEKADGSADA